MTDQDALTTVVGAWLTKADQALDAAHREYDAGDLSLAVNRVYYACFYALSAALLREGLEFRSHAAVRSAFHQFFIKPGRLPVEVGGFYDRVFEDRQEADYTIVAQFEPEATRLRIEEAERFVGALRPMAMPHG